MQQSATLPDVQSNTPATTQHNGQRLSISISIEWIAYGLLLAFALFLRVADLDSVPLTDAEATRALAAWQTLDPTTPGTALTPDSPLSFWWQVTAFSTLGGHEFSARLGGVVGALLLMMMPLLFRQWIGPVRTFSLSLLLAFSPLLLAASRESSPVVWTLVFAAGALWAIWQYWNTANPRYGLWAAAFVGALLFLGGPAGPLLALILLVAGALALWWTAANAAQELDIAGDELIYTVRDALRSFNWSGGLLLAALLVAAVSTGFMLYPQGLSHVAQLLESTLNGLVQAPAPNAPPAWPVLTLLLYNPLLIGFAVAGAVLLLLRWRVNFAERFAGAWFMLALLLLTFYRGATPDYALLLALPLMWLASAAIVELFANRRVLVYWFDSLYADEDDDAHSSRFWWVKWAVALAVCGLLILISVHWAELGRGLLTLPVGESLPNVIQRFGEPALARALRGLIWLLFMPVVLGIVFLFAASVWGNGNVLQGFGLGLLFYMLGAGLAAGWNASVERADDPANFWHLSAVQPDAYLLRDTLQEISRRDTQGFPLIPVTILLDDEAGITESGLVAWLVRDFENARFINTLEDARRDQIVLLPASLPQATEPDLAGSYLGQQFTLRRHWSIEQLVGADVIGWLAQGRTRERNVPADTLIMWLRLDVYDGSPIDQRPRG